MGMKTDVVEATNQAYGTYEKGKTKKADNYGKTIGSPELSEEGKKYYEELKKKYGTMDFILVSADMKEQAKAQAASYANPAKTVVLIDEDKIEKMATDKAYRKQYEGIISGAMANMSQLQVSVTNSGANIKGYGMQVNDGGTVSFFAVLKKSSAAQKARIEKKAAEKKAENKAEKKASSKKAEEKEKEEKLQEKRTEGKGQTEAAEADTVTITANSLEELLQKITDYTFTEKSDYMQTEEEQLLGQHVDFRG